MRIHYLFRTEPGPSELRRRRDRGSAGRGHEAWTDDLRDALLEESARRPGSGATGLRRRVPGRLPRGLGRGRAVADIRHIEETADAGGLGMVPYRSLEAPERLLRCKLFSSQEPIVLSDVLPMFENMGLRITDEQPYELTPRDRGPLWIYDFGFVTGRAAAFDADGVRDLFQEAFIGVWRGVYENDRPQSAGAGRPAERPRGHVAARDRPLPAPGGADARRGRAQRTLTAHADIAALLVALFRARFDPRRETRARAQARSRRRRAGDRRRGEPRPGPRSCAATWRSCGR